jgi:hypothetical protein
VEGLVAKLAGVEGDAVPATDHGLLRRLAQVWTEKWDGRWKYEVGEDGWEHGAAMVFSVAPSKILAFGKGSFSQTRYRF